LIILYLQLAWRLLLSCNNNRPKGLKMPVETLHEGMSVDFADVLLIINIFAISLLLGILYIDEIVATAKRATRLMNPHSLYQRLRFWRTAARTPH
jgi:hypothetical protein